MDINSLLALVFKRFTLLNPMVLVPKKFILLNLTVLALRRFTLLNPAVPIPKRFTLLGILILTFSALIQPTSCIILDI
jgi:hypothetical protein